MIASWAGLVLFLFVMAATPGPNNVMVMASAARYGLRRTLPHMLGVVLGFPVMLAGVGAGLGEFLLESHVVENALGVVAALFMLRMAWRIANSGGPHAVQEGGSRPLNLLEAALFQWLNPKAWAIAVATVALYARGPAPYWTSLAAIAGAFVVICLPCLAGWAWLGRGTGSWLATGRRFRLFNIAMAAVLVLAMLPLAFGG